nr:gamma-glutamylcyclotransferase family protein [Muriicola soli]
MVFSRVLKGSKDQLKAHSVSPEKVGGLYPTIQKSGNAEDKVNGSVFIVSEEEMHLVDSYEGEAYLRKEVILESGIKAWVYLGKMK